MKTKILKIDEIEIDFKLYPRMESDSDTYDKYAGAMKLGDKFPPIVVAKIKKRYVLVDGLHRINANKLNHEECIEAEVLTGLSEKEIYIESIKRNITHGRPFLEEEINDIQVKLEDLDLDSEEISKIIKVPATEIKPMVARTIDSLGEKPYDKGVDMDVAFERESTLNEGVEPIYSNGSIKEDKQDFTLNKMVDTLTSFNTKLMSFETFIDEFGDIDKESFEGKEVKDSLDKVSNIVRKLNKMIRIKEELNKIKNKLEESMNGKPREVESKEEEKYLEEDEEELLSQIKAEDCEEE